MMDSSGETHPRLGSLLLPLPWLLLLPKTSQAVGLFPACWEAEGALGHLTKAMSMEESDEEEEQRSNMATSW